MHNQPLISNQTKADVVGFPNKTFMFTLMGKPPAPSNYSAVIRSTQRRVYKINYLTRFLNHLICFYLKQVFVLMFALFEEQRIWTPSLFTCKFPPVTFTRGCLKDSKSVERLFEIET